MQLFKNKLFVGIGGRAWIAFMGMVFIPMYIHFLGIETYGLIGLFTTIGNVVLIADCGLSPTMTRELAILAPRSDTGQAMRNIVRTLEAIAWLTAMLLGGAICVAAPLIAGFWLTSTSISLPTIQHAIILMGVALVFIWPNGIYSAGLLGVQQHIRLSVINITIATIRGVGSVFFLWIHPSIYTFFFWQIGISVFHTLTLAISLWLRLPPSKEAAQFKTTIITSIWPNFAPI